MKRADKSTRWLLKLVRVLHGMATVGTFLCIVVVFYLCTQPWWDFHTDIKPVSPNKIVVPALGLIFGVGGGFVISNFIESRRNRRNKKSTKSIEV